MCPILSTDPNDNHMDVVDNTTPKLIEFGSQLAEIMVLYIGPFLCAVAIVWAIWMGIAFWLASDDSKRATARKRLLSSCAAVFAVFVLYGIILGVSFLSVPDRGTVDIHTGSGWVLVSDLESINTQAHIVGEKPPVRSNYVVTGGYGAEYTDTRGNKYMHVGVDIAPSGNYGTSTGINSHNSRSNGPHTNVPVYAVAPGVVLRATYQAGGGGYYVAIKLDATTLDGKPIYLNYQHLTPTGTVINGVKAPFISAGTRVTADTMLGWIGNTGNSTGAHLHIEVRIGTDSPNHTQDPVDYLIF